MKLPVVLAGPILRRTEFDRVYIWIACSDEFDISAELFEINKEEGFSYETVKIKTSAKTVRLGEKLFVSMIKVEPISEALPIEQLLGYNLRFAKNGFSFDLEKIGMLNPEAPESIVYGKLKYPSFYITETKKSKLLYGSCRKLHGKGEDSLAEADRLLDQSFLKLGERPEALFLMGDQIYADDVAAPITPFLGNLGEVVTGHKEDLVKVESQLDQEPYKNALDKINGRKTIAAELCKFSSQKASNHLMRFGEYAAMYLLTYNSELWKLAEQEGMIHSFDEAHCIDAFWGDSEAAKAAYDRQLQDLKSFADSLPKVRRLLANIPVYMIFDDHDLTDDWNISSEWKQRVWNARLGRHVIANGLSAYWAFQGWGNNPAAFDAEFTEVISSHVNETDENENTHHNWCEKIWTFAGWHFNVPTYPTAVFLDTRTQRSYSSEAAEGPQLINESGWLQATDALMQSGWETGDPLLIVSPRPLYGIGLFESIIRKKGNPLRLAGFPTNTSLDMESWRYNGKGFESFHKWIIDTDPEYCLILSGDAHFAFSLKADVLYLNGDKRTLYQFTSSPLKNKNFNSITSNLLNTALQLHSLNKNDKNAYPEQKNNLHIELDHDSSHETVAKETIRYDPLENGAIIGTENNLGLLTSGPETIDNKLIGFNGRMVNYSAFTE